MPDSKSVAVPGGHGRLRLTEAGLRATGTNVSGYELFRSAAILRIDAGAPVGGGRILCSVTAPPEAPKSPRPRGLRASYPRSSPDLMDQQVPENAAGRLQLARDRTRRARIRRRLRKLQHRARHQARMARLQGRAASSSNTSSPWSAVQPTRTPASPRSGGRPRSPPPRSPARSTTSAGERPSKTAGALTKRSDADRRRAQQHRTAQAPIRQEEKLSSSGRDEQLGPSIPLPTLFSFGLAGALCHPARRRSGPHIATASSTLEVGAQPGRLGLGARAGSPASGRGPGRRPRSASW